jgi:hypothetical protein
MKHAQQKAQRHDRAPQSGAEFHEGMPGPEHEAMLLENHKKFLWTY